MHWLPLLLLAGLVAVGCTSPRDAQEGAARPGPKLKPSPSPKRAPSPLNPVPVIEPVQAFSGKVVLVNGPLKYVVIEGVIGRLPPVDQALNVYRDGQKVGVVVVSNQARGANFAADLSQGEARVGDTVRSD